MGNTFKNGKVGYLDICHFYMTSFRANKTFRFCAVEESPYYSEGDLSIPQNLWFCCTQDDAL
ncbi:MAG: hypothetical protein ACK5XX_09245, partial [Holosporales bacterium]